SRHPILPAHHPLLPELLGNPRATVASFVLMIDTLDFLRQLGVGLGPYGLPCFRPLVITTTRNTQGHATLLNRKLNRQFFNHRIPLCGSSPSMLIAFFKISRWRLRYSISPCCWRIFSNISSGLICSPSSCAGFRCLRLSFFQRVRLYSVTPMS